MSLRIIDWRITSKCNSDCKFCYAVNNIEPLQKEDIQEVVKKIVSTKCSYVCITGGEPLLNSKETLDIMKKLHNYGIALFLSTNGTNYIENINDIEALISKLSLPLDGYSKYSNTINGRSEGNFEIVKEILDLYNKKAHNFSIKIATILTKKNMNIEHFKKMHDFLKSYSIDLWKIYQFIPEGRGETYINDYNIEDIEYLNFISGLQKYFDKNSSDRDFDISFVGRKERNSAYFIIQPDANVIIPIDDGDVCLETNIGDLKTEAIDDITARWEQKNDKMNVIGNNEKRDIPRPIHKRHIDEIDKRLLFLFDEHPLYDDSKLAEVLREDVTTIAKKMEKLYSIRAIKQIIPIVNVSDFGFDIYLVNLFFSSQNGTSNIKDILCNNSNIGWVAECYDWDRMDGNAIFRIAIFAKNHNHFRNILSDIEEIFGKQLIKYETDIVPEKYVCSQRYMLKENIQIWMDASRINLNHTTTFLSKRELSLLNQLSYMKRPNIKNIATQMKISSQKVERTLELLQKKLIIYKFQSVYDTNILGYKCYLLFLKFKTNFNKKEFEDYVKNKNEVTHINALNSGNWDSDVEIKVEHSEQCFALIEDITNQYRNQISSKRLIKIEKEHKFEFLIPAVLEAAEKQCESSLLRRFLRKKTK